MSDENDDVRQLNVAPEIEPYIKENPSQSLAGAGKVATLVTTKPDAELAEEFKKEVAEAYKPLIEVLDKYDRYGLAIQAGVGKNAFGKFQINQLTVIKQF